MKLFAVVIVVAVLAYLFAWCMFRVAADADRWEEEAFRKWLREKRGKEDVDDVAI